MIIIEKVTKTYTGHGIKVDAIKSINIEFPNVGMIFLLGKSGSGKSTLLNILGGLDSPTSGRIKIDGKLLGKEISLDNYRNETVSFIFQEFHLNRALNAEQNVLLTERLAGRTASTEKAVQALSSVGLEDKAKSKVHQLSGGEMQRVAIARALIKKPKIIFADEPTGKLDEANGAIIFDILKKLSKNTLVVVVSHDRESAEAYGDRIIRLADGIVVSDICNKTLYEDIKEIEKCKELYENTDDTSIQESLEALDNNLKIENLACCNIKADKKNKGNKLSFNNASYLAYKNIMSRLFKTIGIIVICSMLFAILGFSAILFAFSRQNALERTYNKHYDGSAIISNGPYTNYGYEWYRYGFEILDEDAEYFKQNYDSYIEIKRLSNFTFPDFLGGTSFDAFASFNGVFELGNNDLNSLGFKLMNFENAENIFLLENIRSILEALPLPEMLRNRLDTYPIDSPIPAAFIYLVAYTLFNDPISTLNDAAHLPTPHIFGNVGAVEAEDRTRILAFPEFYNIPDIENAVFPEDFWDSFFDYYTDVSFESVLPLSGEPIPIDNSNDYIYHEIAVTDFVVFVLYKRIVELLSPYCDLPLPQDEEELLEFLNNSGFEASVVLLYNALTAFSGGSRFRIAGVIDTGYKEKHAEQLYELSSAVFNGNFRRMNVPQLDLFNDMQNYYLMIYSGKGFALAFEGEEFRVAVSIAVRENQIKELFKYIKMRNEELNVEHIGYEEAGLHHNSIYNNFSWWISNSLNDMRDLFIPIGFLMLIISTAAIAFFLSTAVTKKRKDIGVLKALGANTKGIILIYFLESLVTILLTAVLSTLLNYALFIIVNAIFAASNEYIIDEVVPRIVILYWTPVSLMFSAITVFVTGLIATVYPARKIARLSPVDAIQN